MPTTGQPPRRSGQLRARWTILALTCAVLLTGSSCVLLDFPQTAGNRTLRTIVTFYAAYDNDPPGTTTIAFPNPRHAHAGGTGTADDPVTLASAPAHEAEWQRVAQELQQLLKERRLRVPPGAKGLAARLRIETGELAKSITERFRSQRGPALGQAPDHPREMRAESTRSSLEPGQLSPTLGVTIAGGGSNASIRVVLLDERPL